MTVHGYPPDVVMVFIRNRPTRPLPSYKDVTTLVYNNLQRLAGAARKQLAKVVELRNAIGEPQSADKAQQIKGVTDVGKITNSQFNNNRLSKAVVDKSLSAIDRPAQKENQSLEHTLKTIQS